MLEQDNYKFTNFNACFLSKLSYSKGKFCRYEKTKSLLFALWRETRLFEKNKRLVLFNFLSMSLINCLRHVCDVFPLPRFGCVFIRNAYVQSCVNFVKEKKSDEVLTYAALSQLPCIVLSRSQKICLFRSIKIISHWTFNVAALCQNKSNVIERKGFISVKL